MNVGSSSQTPIFCSALTFVDCHCKSRPVWELAPVPFNKLLILMLYFYTVDENFLSSAVSRGDIIIERNARGFIKDDSCTIAKSLLAK